MYKYKLSWCIFTCFCDCNFVYKCL